MKNYKFKRQYIRIILRPIKVLKLSLVYFYGRIALSLAIRGIELPGLDAIKKRIPQSALEVYERKVLIYEIKGERYSLQAGPIWIRKLIEKLKNYILRNKFWFLITIKTILATLIIAIPILIFILLRGVLPVPERVPYNISTTKLNPHSNIKVDWLYTEGPFLAPEVKNSEDLNYNFIDPQNTRGISITPVLEKNAPAGLMHLGIGYYPIKFNLVRGFLVAENSDITIKRNRNSPIEVEDGNKLRIQYYLLPTKDNITHQCKIQLTNENGQIIATHTEITPLKNTPRSPNSIKTAWNERFVPNSIPNYGTIGEFVINLTSPPKKILASVQEITNNTSNHTANLNQIFSKNNYSNIFEQVFSSKSGKDISENNCIFALGDFSFEKTVVKPPKRRGIIFIVVDTLKAETAYDEEIMPNLNNFAKNYGIKFLEHRAQSNMTVPSIISLMTSHYPREIGSVAFTYAADYQTKQNFYNKNIKTVANTMQNLGYRVGGIGWLSLFTEALEGGLDLGFHNAILTENPEYEARQITEQMGNWLENYGDAPFFLYLHYNTSHGPYKPPVDKIDLLKFLSKPFGLNQKRQLYNAVGRYWDSEFPNIIQKLKDLGIYDDVDIIITADHGAQLNVQPWYYFLGVPQNLDGGYADKGNSLFDEELKVPLIIKLANETKKNGYTVSKPTAHIDLFPTLSHLAGNDKNSNNWRGLDLLPALTDNSFFTFNDILDKRKHIYFDAHKYAGILFWDDIFSNNPVKYMRQLTPDNVKLYLTHNPWSQKISWYQPEMFSFVNFSSHTENVVPNISSSELVKLRKAYYDISPSDKMLRFIPKFSGNIKFLVTLNSKESTKPPEISLIPDKINSQIKRVENHFLIHFHGETTKNEEIWLNLGNSDLLQINFDTEVKLVSCANGVFIAKEYITNILNNNICSFYAPPEGVLDSNYSPMDRVLVIQKTLANEQVQQIEGAGAGAALQNALRDWGYAK